MSNDSCAATAQARPCSVAPAPSTSPTRSRCRTIGRTWLGSLALHTTVAAGEEFEVQLGVDDQIRVERQLCRHRTSKAVLGGTRTIDIAYEITVQNHRPNMARLRVHDPLPLPAGGATRARTRGRAPAPAEQNDLGELVWDLSLEGGQAGTIRYRFTVEHPAQGTVVGLWAALGPGGPVRPG